MRRPPLLDTFGLRPLPTRFREAVLALTGDEHTPRSKFGPSSLKQMQPIKSVKLWLGVSPLGRRAEIFNFYNRTPTPVEEGWSTLVTQARDFRGKDATYDSHNGTDFAVPPGSRVTSAAPGVVLRVSSEFNRGGLKVFIDHGEGLVTTSNHLAKSLVNPGDVVGRGEVVALSGYSGLDGLSGFPWVSPHVHYNVWLNGAAVDPFAMPHETSLWRRGNWPAPFDGTSVAEKFTPTEWDADLVEAAIAECLSEGSVRELRSYDSLAERAMAVLMHQIYYPTRFRSRPNIYSAVHERTPRLDLPLHRDEFDGVIYKRETS
jgi:murein DD-endopeptidase MepM/ murein hydrolase activator NlpD